MTDATTPAALRSLADRIETNGIDMDTANELAAAYERHNTTGDGWTMRRDDAGFLARMNSVDAAVAEMPAGWEVQVRQTVLMNPGKWFVFLENKALRVQWCISSVAPTLPRAWHAANLRAMVAEMEG